MLGHCLGVDVLGVHDLDVVLAAVLEVNVVCPDGVGDDTFSNKLIAV